MTQGEPSDDTRLRVGDRVVVRYRLPEASPGEPGLTDAVGDLLEVEADLVTVRTRRRGDVVIPRAAVVAAKRLPGLRRP